MFLKSIRIQHYKSLADVSIVNLQPITLLVGSNAVGKSNVIDALKFLRDIAANGLDHAMSDRGGIEIIRQYSKTSPFKITMSVDFEQSFGDDDIRSGSSDITIVSQKGNYRVEHEAARWWLEIATFEEVGDEEEGVAGSDITEQKFTRDVTGKVKFNKSVEDNYRVAEDMAALGIRWPNAPYELIRYFSSFSFSTIYPNTLRTPSRPDTERMLKESGQNWASVLKALRKTQRGRQALERVMEMMQVVMPTLQEVNVKSAGGFLVPQFRVKDDERSNAHDFDPVQLSDGTLRILGILLALYQTPPPPFLALEEPEQTVNPAILATLSEAFREVSEHTQLFITSHSPHLVDYFDPDEIRVVSMKQGKTQVSSIHPAQKEAVKENLITIEELMIAEGLLPEDMI